MTQKFAPGQHVVGAGHIEVVVNYATAGRFKGMYTTRPLGNSRQSPGCPEYLLEELTEAHLCRLPRHGCGKIHVPADYVIGVEKSIGSGF